jgi:hypothetical protein
LTGYDGVLARLRLGFREHASNFIGAFWKPM